MKTGSWSVLAILCGAVALALVAVRFAPRPKRGVEPAAVSRPAVEGTTQPSAEVGR